METSEHQKKIKRYYFTELFLYWLWFFEFTAWAICLTGCISMRQGWGMTPFLWLIGDWIAITNFIRFILSILEEDRAFYMAISVLS